MADQPTAVELKRSSFIDHLFIAAGDVLVVKFKGKISQQDDARLEVYLKERLPEGIKFLIIDDSVELSVIHKPEQIEPMVDED